MLIPEGYSNGGEFGFGVVKNVEPAIAHRMLNTRVSGPKAYMFNARKG
jgi:hypothetical protein